MKANAQIRDIVSYPITCFTLLCFAYVERHSNVRSAEKKAIRNEIEKRNVHSIFLSYVLFLRWLIMNSEYDFLFLAWKNDIKNIKNTILEVSDTAWCSYIVFRLVIFIFKVKSRK